MFQKGVSGNPAGKKPGTKDQKWKSAQAVWDMLMEQWPKLTPSEKAKFSMDVFKMHFERAIAQLPKDQADSLTNANKLMEDLKALERSFDTGTAVKNDTRSMADRQVTVQAKADTAGH